MTWQTIYEDTDKRVEQDADGIQRTVWLNPEAVGARLEAIEARLDAAGL